MLIILLQQLESRFSLFTLNPILLTIIFQLGDLELMFLQSLLEFELELLDLLYMLLMLRFKCLVNPALKLFQIITVLVLHLHQVST